MFEVWTGMLRNLFKICDATDRIGQNINLYFHRELRNGPRGIVLTELRNLRRITKPYYPNGAVYAERHNR